MELNDKIIDRLKKRNLHEEKRVLRDIAQKSIHAKRRNPEQEDYRSKFSHDADRILHSLSYARYYDKTQVFFWIDSDVHQRRMHHVQIVAKMSRDIAQVLGLNQDLVEAIALGHDIGHVPFGHDGEEILDEITRKEGIGRFSHNFESVWFLQEIEMQNLTLPVIDGILSHNGETHPQKLVPDFDGLTWEQHEKDMGELLLGKNLDPTPKTLEGCLVRFIDTISYISRDIRDAEILGVTGFDELPPLVKNRLGSSNREIINSLISDLIMNSIDRDYISYSLEVHQALQELYKFNYKKIYAHPDKLKPISVIRKAFRHLWDKYYEDLIEGNTKSRIFKEHFHLNLSEIQTRYPEIRKLEDYPYYHQDPKIIVRDFIAGMTDVFFWRLAKEIDPNLVFSKKKI